MRTNVQVMFSMLLVLVFVPIATAQPRASADARNERQHLAEFPAADAQIAFLEGTGIRAKNWASLLERERDSPEAVTC
jgi:hypothetical protein